MLFIISLERYLWLCDMPNHLAFYQTARHRAKTAAVLAVDRCSNQENRFSAIFQPLDDFNPPALAWVVVDNHVAGPDSAQQNGQGRDKNVIAVPVPGIQTATGNPDDLKNHSVHRGMECILKPGSSQGLDKPFLRRAYKALSPAWSESPWFPRRFRQSG